MYSADDFRQLLRDECADVGSIRQFGRIHKLTAGHVSRVIRGEKEPGPKLLKVFGLEAVVAYRLAPRQKPRFHKRPKEGRE